MNTTTKHSLKSTRNYISFSPISLKYNYNLINVSSEGDEKTENTIINERENLVEPSIKHTENQNLLYLPYLHNYKIGVIKNAEYNREKYNIISRINNNLNLLSSSIK